MDPILVTIGQICHFHDPNLVSMYLILNKEHLLVTYSTDILVRLLTVNEKNCLIPKSENVQPHSTNSIENATPW